MEKSAQTPSEAGTGVSTPVTTVMGGDDKAGLTPLKKLLFIVGGVVILAIVGIVVYFLSNHATPQKPVAPTVTAIDDTDYQTLSPSQLDQKFLTETGHEISSVGDNDFNTKTFQTFRAAYVAARVYRFKQDYKHSQKAFAVAASETDQTTTYQFYLDYIAVADINGDKTLSNQLTEKEKSFISNDKSLSKPQKQDLLDEIAQKQKLKEQAD